ncbi:MAG: alpha/beta hydrolase [Cyanobacteria bacterium SZAS LIN-5]|nr:alpha/beta hydrolase [Cyanobacteria bacterium SZAS LIN-5]
MKINTVLLALCSLLAMGTTVRAETAKVKRSYVTIPVLYVTDRAPTKKGYGPQRKNEDLTTIDELRFGWLDYALKTDKSVGEGEKQLGWVESPRSPDKVLNMRTQRQTASLEDFGNYIIEAAKKSGTREVFVLVHGFNTPFANAAQSAALLEHAVRRPVILYSWPSKGRLGQYGVDLGNNEWSQEHFDSMLDELAHVREKSGISFNLIAHSMGNRIAVHSAPVLKGRHIFQQMYLVDPDFDAETFVHYLYRYARKKDEHSEVATRAEVVKSSGAEVAAQSSEDGIASDGSGSTKIDGAGSAGATTKIEGKESVAADVSDSVVDAQKKGALPQPKVRILFSHKDKALPLSELIFGGYTRLGQAADSLLSSVSSPLSLPGILGDAFNSVVPKEENKEATADGASTAAEDGSKRKQPQWMLKFEWIDFTALDHGLIGHTIPYNLIANLWSNDTPGEGLKLVPSQNGSPNKLSSIFSHLFGEKDHISSKIVTAQRVVPVSKEDLHE